MPQKAPKIITTSIAIVFSLAFLYAFGRGHLIRSYLYMGIGNCQSIPILCATAGEKFQQPAINKDYLQEMLPYKFGSLEISLPKGFKVIRGQIQKAYYKKLKYPSREGVVYLLYEKPGFFTGLFPQVKKQGITDNRAFLKHTMNADIRKVNNLSDAFFVVMKSIFIPDIGRQASALITVFSLDDKAGFINYNLGKDMNYYDCNIVDKDDRYFKVYIKDPDRRVSLDEVFAVISTVNEANKP
jgi:hypothetical protein